MEVGETRGQTAMQFDSSVSGEQREGDPSSRVKRLSMSAQLCRRDLAH